ncbi:MAG TPA: hypothetical protein V6D22_00355 [Candidatus Obscuribacterales bacterium]
MLDLNLTINMTIALGALFMSYAVVLDAMTPNRSAQLSTAKVPCAQSQSGRVHTLAVASKRHAA